VSRLEAKKATLFQGKVIMLQQWQKQGLVGLSTLTMAILGTGYPQVATALTTDKVNLQAQATTGFPVVKSARLKPSMRVPWSKPVRVTDTFEGNYLAVFDKHYWQRGFLGTDGSVQVISLWSPRQLRVLATEENGKCIDVDSMKEPEDTLFSCFSSNANKNIIGAFVKVGDRVFQLDSENGAFIVSDKLAKALRNAPVENARIRLVVEGGEDIDSEIGEGTVKAWRTVYQR
jgi:hypothetical protein